MHVCVVAAGVGSGPRADALHASQNNGSLKVGARLKEVKLKIGLLKMKGKPLPCLNCQNNQSDCQRRLQPLQVRGQHASRHEASN